MDSVTALLRRRLFGIDPRETTFERRGFWSENPDAVVQLERVGASFVEGYHLALRVPDATQLADALSEVERDWRGFACEGAGMALALLDCLTPWNRGRLPAFLAGAGASHVYMVTIGAGWAWARLGGSIARVDRQLARLDPILGWLALDGFGFHEGYFHPDRTVAQQQRPAQIRGYGARVFDAGLGRSLWFVCGASPERLAEQIAKFVPERQADLWGGAGLACTYACGVSDAEIEKLAELSGSHRGSLAQGAAFAAKARERAGNPVPHTKSAISGICRTSPELAAKLCDTELENQSRATTGESSVQSVPAFERWRSGVRQTFERSFAAEIA